jgi:hypothetical protein
MSEQSDERSMQTGDFINETILSTILFGVILFSHQYFSDIDHDQAKFQVKKKVNALWFRLRSYTDNFNSESLCQKRW